MNLKLETTKPAGNNFLQQRAAFVVTIEEAAAPQSSLAFMFWGEGLFVFPLMLFYTAISYSVFRGKVSSTAGYLSQVDGRHQQTRGGR